MSCKCNSHSDSANERRDYQYAVKIVVGNIPKGAKEPLPLPKGSYYTKVNVHNYSRCDCVTFRWKVAIGHPGLKVGPISGFSDATLCPDEALEIVNRDILEKLKQSGHGAKHFEGWVVIESPEELDVVAVYATADNDHQQVNAFHTERVQPRCMIPCEDLYGDLSSGVAKWQVKRPESAQFDWAVLSTKNPSWAAAPSGAVWLSPSGDGSSMEREGEYVYRLPFKLCSGFSNPVIQFALAADSKATVRLNNTTIAPTSGTASLTTFGQYSISSGFKAGDNELTIVVKNTDTSPTGLLLHGSIVVERGQCPGEGFARWVCPRVCYKVHVKRIWPWVTGAQGWMDGVCDGIMAGTTDERRRVEAFIANLNGASPNDDVPPGTRIEYAAFVSPLIGAGSWTPWIQEGNLCGTTGGSKKIEAIKVRFVVAPPCCSISYQVYMKHKLSDKFTRREEPGWWSEWVRDGAVAGTTTDGRRIEALKMTVECLK